MKIFISWSGKLSHEFSKILNDWLHCVLPNVETFLSSSSLDPGDRWSAEIAAELDHCNAGIICLTSENIMSPWINFEAGALSKNIEKSLVIPLLVDITIKELGKSPLTQFQSLSIDQASLKKLLNKLFDTLGISNSNTTKIFDKWWNDLETDIKKLEFPNKKATDEKKYETLLNNYNEVNEDLKIRLNQMEGILENLTSNKTDYAIGNLKDLERFTGLWVNEENNSTFYGLLIDNKFVMPYLYYNEEESLAHYYNIKLVGNRLYGKFSWFNRDLNGYFYLDIINDELLKGGWLYSHEVSFIRDEEINSYTDQVTELILKKVHSEERPKWVSEYISEELYR